MHKVLSKTLNHKVAYGIRSSQVIPSQKPRRYEAEKNISHIRGELINQAGIITLNRSNKFNRLDPTMADELYRFLESFALDEDMKFVWIQSEDKQLFSTGNAYKNLEQIQKLAYYLANYQKFLFTKLSGQISGPMAGYVSNLGFNFIDGNVKLTFNDKFIPHGGASYQLARIPYLLGRYLALTGDSLNENQLYDMEFAYGHMVEDLISQMGLLYSNPVHSTQAYNNKSFFKLLEDLNRNKKQEDEINRRIQKEDAKLVVAEILYLNANRSKNEEIQPLMNPTLQMIDQNLSVWLHDQEPKNDVRLNEEIRRCFSANSVKEIMRRLKDERIKDKLEKMEHKDVILKLMVEAEKSTFKRCLELELEAGNYILDKQDKTHYLNLVDGLLPGKNYYEEYPDNIRLFLNEQSLNKNYNERLQQEYDVEIFLKNNKFNMNSNMSADLARNVIMQLETARDQARQRYQKLQALVANSRFYYEERLQYIEDRKLSHSEIEQTIEEVFNEALKKRESQIEYVSSIQTFKEKMDFFSRIRNTILNEKLTESKDTKPRKQEGLNYQLIFPDNNDESFLNVVNKRKPFLKETYWYYIHGDEDPNSKEMKCVNDYELRYGDFLKEFNVEKYHARLKETAKKFPKISEFMEQNGEKIDEILSTNIKMTDEELNQIIDEMTYGAQHQQQMNFEFQKKNKEIVLGEFEKELSQIYDKVTVLQNTKGSLEQFIRQDQDLDKLLDPILNLKQVPEQCQELAKSLKLQLISLYNAKIKPFKLKKQQKLDEYFQKQVEYDLYRIVEPHVFFTFSYILVKKLEDMYNTTNLDYGYLNKLTNISAVLYDQYRDRLQFEEDLQLYSKIKLDQFNRRKQNQFSDYVYVSQEILGKLENKAKLNSGYITPDQIIEQVFQKWYESNTLSERPKNPIHLPRATIWQKGKYESTIFNSMLQYMMQKNKIERKLIQGYQGYLNQIDRLVKRVQTTTDQELPEQIREEIEQLEKLQVPFTLEETLEEWYQNKLKECISNLVLVKDEVILNDIELLKRMLVLSLNKDLEEIQSIGQEYQLMEQEEIQKDINKLKQPIKDLDIQNIPLYMTAQYFKDDKRYNYLAMIKSSLYQHPLSKEFKKSKKEGYHQDEITKIQRELVEGLDDVVTGMHESKSTWDNLYNELDELYDRIQLRRESLQE